ncbi:MAG: hypothetical protein M1816_003857 [Peltula sp. TS41687]|nr:MAG: hypothetical protein M1816_003857 [Peltula sp. TS41687]
MHISQRILAALILLTSQVMMVISAGPLPANPSPAPPSTEKESLLREGRSGILGLGLGWATSNLPDWVQKNTREARAEKRDREEVEKMTDDQLYERCWAAMLADLSVYRHRPGENDLIAHPKVARPARTTADPNQNQSEERIRNFEIDFIQTTCRIRDKASAVVLSRLKEKRLLQVQGKNHNAAAANTLDNNNRAIIIGDDDDGGRGHTDAFKNLKVNTIAYVNRFGAALSNANLHSNLRISLPIAKPIAAPAMLVP